MIHRALAHLAGTHRMHIGIIQLGIRLNIGMQFRLD